MTPTELLLEYPQMAMSLLGGIFQQKQTDPRLQQAMDMAMQMSTPLVGGITESGARLNQTIAGRILNRAEISPATQAMSLLGMAGKFLRPAGKKFGLTQKTMSRLTPYEVFDEIGKIIRKRKR